jgi:hypothetical protein
MRTHLTRTLVWLILIGALQVGCSTVSDGPFEQVSGRYMDSRRIDQMIVDQKTTIAEVVAWLGDPVETASGPLGQTSTFRSVRERTSASETLFSRKKTVRMFIQELVVVSSAGLVTAHSYREELRDR